VKDRSRDILYVDRTYDDQYATSIATDYIDFINSLNDIAIKNIKEEKDRNAFRKKFESLKAQPAKSTSCAIGENRKYEDLIRGRFELINVERI
jgi:hypothetical protein